MCCRLWGKEPPDPYGNLIAHYRHRPAPDQPPIAFVAHMDHPGFEVIEVQGNDSWRVPWEACRWPLSCSPRRSWS